MSSPLAIGAVSAVLRNLLDNGLVDVGAPLGSVKVTAVAPDTIKLDDPDAAAARSTSSSTARARTSAGQKPALPAFDGNGSRLSNPPLALNLHYLLTAYGNADFQAEILLGYAMHLLHERPVLDRAAILRALDPSPLGASILPPAFQTLTASDLADQVDAVTVTPEPMDTEEMSRLWSAMQAHYRPSAPLPRLGRADRGAQADAQGAAGALARARSTRRRARSAASSSSRACCRRTRRSSASVPPDAQPAARLGETVRLEGPPPRRHRRGRRASRTGCSTTPNEVVVGASTDASGIDVALPSGADRRPPTGRPASTSSASR